MSVWSLGLCTDNVNYIQHDLAKQEKALVIYTVLITSIHLVKSGQQVVKPSWKSEALLIYLQIFWYVTMVINDPQLFDLATIMASNFFLLFTKDACYSTFTWTFRAPSCLLFSWLLCQRQFAMRSASHRHYHRLECQSHAWINFIFYFV